MPPSRLLAVALAAALAAAAAPLPITDPASADRIRGHVQFLASDELEGRETGTRGHAVAARYVAAQFASLGLKPGGPGGWYLQVPLRRASHSKPPRVRIIAGGRNQLLDNADVGLRPSLTEKQRSIDAGLVFVGHGVIEPRFGIDEYAGLDVRGKIVVILRGTPGGLPVEVAAHVEQAKAQTAAARGAIGIAELSFGPPNSALAAGASRPVVDWVDASGAAGTLGILRAYLVLSPGLSRQLFSGAPRSLNQISASAARPVRGFALPARLSIAASSDWHDFTSPQVIGLLPGADPRLANEHVVVMAHLDHLGAQAVAAPGEDAIYNGAIDNAAGIATMIETARQFAESGQPPRRSILFMANTGEEIGLLGADYFITHPTVPLNRIVAAVALDMPLLLYDFTDVVVFGAVQSTVTRAVEQAARRLGLAVSPDPMPEQTIVVRSDHYQFVRRGVPAVLLFTGYANGGKAQWERYLASVYHTPKDDLTQPINWTAGARYARLNYEIARLLADSDQRPRWLRGDYFGDRFAPGQPRSER
jgi:hypothetical protein